MEVARRFAAKESDPLQRALRRKADEVDGILGPFQGSLGNFSEGAATVVGEEPNWGRVAGVFALARMHLDAGNDVTDELGAFLEGEGISNWILDSGGWDAFVKWAEVPPSFLYYPFLFFLRLLQVP